MKKESKKMYQPVSFTKDRRRLTLIRFLLSLLFLCSLNVFAQNSHKITGKVVDEQNNPIIGATVALKNTTTGVFTDEHGLFLLNIPAGKQTLVVTYIGMEVQEFQTGDKTQYLIVLKDKSFQLNETVIVGYGKQKKESVVGAITQTSGKTLQRAGGITNVGAALTGNVPGVTTVQSVGTPGGEDPKIFIRGQSTWNNSDPLVLIDGIERSMQGLDINSIESVSVLKDASATAVFGVKGANGVILITTKRGAEGKVNIQVIGNTAVKFLSKLPDKYDAYDALLIRNRAIEREVGLNESSWADYTPYDVIRKYRYPLSPEEAQRYPNIDWRKELFNDFATSYNTNISVSGGTPFVKYFSSADLVHEGDLMKTRNNGKGYTSGYGYTQLNVRSNLDINITKTTKLSLNLAGQYADKQDTWSGFEYRMWQAFYTMAPNVFPPVYNDGTWGYYPKDQNSTINSSEVVSNSGARHTKTTKIYTDFALDQDLSFVLKGLSARGTYSMDNTFISEGGIYDESGNTLQKWISPDGQVYWNNPFTGNHYDRVVTPWTARPDVMQDKFTGRKIFYQLQLNYLKTIGKNNITAMGLFSRDERATGNEFPHYREDWVFRTTYNFDSRYFFEMNGAYNGSEKFGRDFRFAFFPSWAVGWMLSQEKFMENFKWLDMFKIRGSYGLVGDDSGGDRWLYMTQWSYENKAHLGANGGDQSPYTWYKEKAIGNENIHWEKVTKKNVGVDYSFFNSLISGSFDAFNDYRTDILLAGGRRAVPDYFGNTPPTANLGKVSTKGFEMDVKLNYVLGNGLRLWADFNMTHSKDKILDADNPQLLAAYQKSEGFQIGQPKYKILNGFYNTWDEVYGSSVLQTYDGEKLPGNYNVIDFNGDGVIDDYDAAPYSYPDRPQNSYSATIGFEYKGFSAFVQFYGVNNVSRYMSYSTFGGNMDVVFNQGDYWSKDNTNADSFLPRWKTHIGELGNYYLWDASFQRLKTAEVSYTSEAKWVQKLRLKSLRVFVNGNNLLLWSKMPDDRESNFDSWAATGAYPTMRRVNFGINITL